ncbi:MAG: hypothetical protein AAFR81_03260 [Chloroflexota bacterium]
MTQTTGDGTYTFKHRPDLHTIPSQAISHEVNLHTSFAIDQREGFGHIYYTLPEVGIIQIAPDMTMQTVIPIEMPYRAMNFHSTRIAHLNGVPHFFLSANENEKVVVMTMAGEHVFTWHRPTLAPYSEDEQATYKPTDSVLVDGQLFVADGYGSDYVAVVDANDKTWQTLFGGHTDNRLENGKFRTAHNIARTPDGEQLIIADRWNSRFQVHDYDGTYSHSYHLPYNAWVCSIDFIKWRGQSLGIVACLYDEDEDKKRPAPLYVVDAGSFEILATLRPKEDLGIEQAQRLHNAVWHVHDDSLYIIAHAWNPGYFFVLEQAS